MPKLFIGLLLFTGAFASDLCNGRECVDDEEVQVLLLQSQVPRVQHNRQPAATTTLAATTAAVATTAAAVANTTAAAAAATTAAAAATTTAAAATTTIITTTAAALTASTTSTKPVSYGDSACPCVGLTNVKGFMNVTIGGVLYPDLYPRKTAGQCEAWDEGKYPGSCDGDAPASWCSDEWCYVDPCNCDLTVIGTAPKKSTYFPGAEYQGHDLYYSYATCESNDTYTNSSVAAADAAAIDTVCADTIDTATWGDSTCPCVGISNRNGTTEVVVSNVGYQYPATYGTSCSNHDSGLEPSCNVASSPSWCESKWCYVDPCNCAIAEVPKPTDYLPGAVVAGNPIYYSYTTCGGTDTYTSDSTVETDIAAICA